MRRTAVLFCFFILLVNVVLVATGIGFVLAVSGCCTHRTAIGLPIFLTVVATMAVWQLCRALRARRRDVGDHLQLPIGTE